MSGIESVTGWCRPLLRGHMQGTNVVTAQRRLRVGSFLLSALQTARRDLLTLYILYRWINRAVRELINIAMLPQINSSKTNFNTTRASECFAVVLLALPSKKPVISYAHSLAKLLHNGHPEVARQARAATVESCWIEKVVQLCLQNCETSRL